MSALARTRAAFVAATLALPLPAFAVAVAPYVETIDGIVTSPAYTYGGSISVPSFTWEVHYDRSFDGVSVVKQVEILFSFVNAIGYTSQQKAAWAADAEQAIESIWNGKYVIEDKVNNKVYSVGVDVVPTVVLAPGADQTVSVELQPAGCSANPNNLACRDSMTRWFVDSTDSIQAHEFGHMIGLYDEYLGGALDSATNPTLSSDGLMGLGALSATPVMYERYYQQHLSFLAGIDLASYPGGSVGLQTPELVLRPVPEPGTWALMAVGAVLVGTRLRRCAAA